MFDILLDEEMDKDKKEKVSNSFSAGSAVIFLDYFICFNQISSYIRPPTTSLCYPGKTPEPRESSRIMVLLCCLT